MSNKHGVGISNILKNIKEGDDLTTLAVMYYDTFRHRNNPNEIVTANKNAMFIVYKDGKHKKYVQAIVDPKMRIYFVKPEYRDFTTPREYLEIDKCYHVDTTPTGVLKAIRKEMQQSDDPITQTMLNIERYALASKIKGAAKEILKWPYTMFSDLDIESYYRIMLGYHYNQSHGHTVDKCFLDIESDIYGLTSSETAMNLDKTNACTLIFHFDENGAYGGKKTQVFTLLLRNYERYPQQQYFEEHLDAFIEECHAHFDQQTIIKDGKKKIIDCTADYHILLFDEEIDLLKNIFKLINSYRPDTCEVWNIAYDIPKLYARLERNGIYPPDVMCDPAWPKDYKWVEMSIDNRPIDIAERKTSIRMASTTIYIDQMQSYAGIRKGRKAYGSSRLDNIAKIELGMGKWEFKPGVNVTNACIKDYWNFVLYNIRDVWCQDLIDVVTNDTMAMIYDMNQSFCPLKSLFKQVTYQRQIYYTQRLNRGFISGNNPNLDYLHGDSEEMAEWRADMEEARKRRMMLDGEETDRDEDLEDDDEESDETDRDSSASDEDEFEDKALSAEDATAKEVLKQTFDPYWDDPSRELKLMGGMVGNPDNNIANGTEIITGIKSKHIYDDVLDMDFASEYPWAKFTRSLSKSTQFGRLIIPGKISDRQNCLPLGQQKRQEDQKYYTNSSEFISDYISGDVISFANVWFGLPTVTEMNEKLRKKHGLMKEEES